MSPSTAVQLAFATTAKTAVERELQNNPVVQAVAGKVECRTHTCRLEIRDARNAEVSKQLQMFVHKLGGTLPRAQADPVEDANGQLSLVLYMADQEPLAQGPNNLKSRTARTESLRCAVGSAVVKP